MSEHYENGSKKTKQIMSEETKEKNRIRARNYYRKAAGISLDNDLMPRGGAHHVKYASKEEAKLAKEEKQKLRNIEKYEEITEYQKKYRAEHKEEFITYRKQKYKLMKEKKNEEKDVVVEQSIYASNMTRKEYNKNYYLKNKEKMNEQSKQNYNSKKVGNCSDCPEYFDAGKDNCKTCDFDLNSYNKPDESDEDEECDCDTLTISQITNDLDEYMKKYKISFNV